VAEPLGYGRLVPAANAEDDPLHAIDSWPVPTAAAGWTNGARTELRGPTTKAFALASVTKPLVAYAVLVAIEEGSLHLDTTASQTDGSLPDVTVRHLMSHAGGIDPDQRRSVAQPGTRRIYSNAGFEILGDLIAATTGFAIADYLHEAVLAPLAMPSTQLLGSPAHGAVSSVEDLLRFAAELLTPTLLDRSTLRAATTPAFAELTGVLPGFGHQEPNPWGLGFEIKGRKDPHWTGTDNSPSAFGHFGRAGTMLWVDPEHQRAAVALTDRDFGPWAAEAWPPFSNAILGAR